MYIPHMEYMDVYGQDNLLTCRYGRCFLVCFHIYLSCPAPISSAATVPDGLNDDNSPREEAQEGYFCW
jgi:hypothetical protein